MDPLTHTLLGANLASTRLGTSTRFATAALVAGANLPDLDAILYFTGHDDLALGFRRGWTHGVLALFVLPFVLTGLLLALDRLRPRPGHPASPRLLLLLSFGAILTHPFLDWLNTYGMRWLMPFDGTWFYGDTVFIMDPLLWLALGLAWLLGRAPTKGRIGLLVFFSLAIAWVVGGRSAGYLGVVAAIALVMLGALLWRPKGDPATAIRRFAAAGLTIAALYVGARLAIHAATEARVVDAMAARGLPPVTRLMAGPHPFDPGRWDVVAQSGDQYRFGRYLWFRGGLTLDPRPIPVAKDSPEWRAAIADPSVKGFVTWMRFPAYEVERAGGRTLVHLQDARRAGRSGGRMRGRTVDVTSTIERSTAED